MKSLLLASLLVPAMFAAHATESVENTAYARFQSAAVNNEFVANWYLNQRTFLLRDRLDREVYATLLSDPEAIQIMGETRAELETYNTQQRIKLLGLTSLASEDQYPALHKSSLDIARRIGFPEAAINNSYIFVAQSPDVNGYTYNALRSTHIDLVLFTGLQAGMSPAAVEAVVAHEMGHQMAEHVLMSVVVDTIFMKTGRELIPEEERLSMDSMIRKSLKKALAQLMPHIDDDGTVLNDLFSVVERLVKKIDADPKRSERVRLLAEKLIRLATPAGQPILTADYAEQALRRAAAARKVSVAAAEGEESGDEPADEGPDIKEIKKHQEAMERLTQSGEITSDRFAVTYTSKEQLMESMAWLAGGAGANPAAFGKQLERQILLLEQSGINIADIDNASHPWTVYRVTGINNFLASPEYKILKDPFLGLVDMTLKTYRVVNHAQQVRGSRQSLGWVSEMGIRADKFLSVGQVGAEEIGKILAAEVRAVVKSKKPESLVNFRKLLDYFQQGYSSDAFDAYGSLFAQLPEQQSYSDYQFLGKAGGMAEVMLKGLKAIQTDKKSSEELKSTALYAEMQIRQGMGLYIEDVQAGQAGVDLLLQAANGELVGEGEEGLTPRDVAAGCARAANGESLD